MLPRRAVVSQGAVVPAGVTAVRVPTPRTVPPAPAAGRRQWRPVPRTVGSRWATSTQPPVDTTLATTRSARRALVPGYGPLHLHPFAEDPVPLEVSHDPLDRVKVVVLHETKAAGLARLAAPHHYGIDDCAVPAEVLHQVLLRSFAQAADEHLVCSRACWSSLLRRRCLTWGRSSLHLDGVPIQDVPPRKDGVCHPRVLIRDETEVAGPSVLFTHGHCVQEHAVRAKVLRDGLAGRARGEAAQEQFYWCTINNLPAVLDRLLRAEGGSLEGALTLQKKLCVFGINILAKLLL
mmetsp:Transcript_116751/g.325317  ORF Transcript_116751/g.325317 Transcript_116751/m.325317 type:complete len:292 (+) Transcript_116751:324-1199(+)